MASFLVAPITSWATPLTDLISQSQALLANKQAPQAYEQLQAQELTYAGTPEFDYWLGIAAIRSGNASVGVLALDRLLLVNPNHAGGRLERAMAMVQLGMLDEADQELSVLEKQNPPKQAAQVITQYRNLIAKQRQQANSPQHSAMISLGGGYDSNVNTAPNNYVLELFGGLFQSKVSEQDSNFADLRAQYNGHFPLSTIHSVQATVAAQSRQYGTSSLTDYNMAVVQGALNWRYAPSADWVVDTSGSASRVYSGQPLASFIDQLDLQSELSVPVFQESRLTLKGQGRTLAYVSSNQNDVDALLAGVNLQVPLNAQWRVRTGLSAEQEQAKANRDGGDALRLKGQLGFTYKHNVKHQFQLGINYQKLSYRDKGFALYNDLVASKRKDATWQLSSDWSWRLTPQWTMSTQASYRHQNSNLNYFDYNQLSLSTNIAYIWR